MLTEYTELSSSQLKVDLAVLSKRFWVMRPLEKDLIFSCKVPEPDIEVFW